MPSSNGVYSLPPGSKPVTDPALLAKLNASDDIHIGAPDGSVVAFPAGTSDDTIRAAMGKAYPSPKPEEPKSTLQTIREAIHAPTRALENGAFLGLGDRARAVVDSTVDAVGGNGFNYGENLKKEQGDTEEFAKPSNCFAGPRSYGRRYRAALRCQGRSRSGYSRWKDLGWCG
jgi:hypothetical protein